MYKYHAFLDDQWLEAELGRHGGKSFSQMERYLDSMADTYIKEYIYNEYEREGAKEETSAESSGETE